MDENRFHEISHELSHAGEPVSLPQPQTTDVVRLLKHRITADTQLPKMEFLFRLFGVPCFPRGELVAVAGKAKSGKTFFLSILMALLRGKILWYDTEQSEQSTQDILVNRIIPMMRGHTEDEVTRKGHAEDEVTQKAQKTQKSCASTHRDQNFSDFRVTNNPPAEEHFSDFRDFRVTNNPPAEENFCDFRDFRVKNQSKDFSVKNQSKDFCVTKGRTDNIFAFNVRCENGDERLRLFATAVAHLQPDLVVLDGVRDLISDINDGVEAQRLTGQLMTLAQRHRCCIVCVLHQNKGDGDRNLRGWIGTELTNKVFEVYACEKLKGSSTFRVEQTHTRKYDIGRELYYQVDPETGLPTMCDKPQEQPRDDKGRWASPRRNPAPEEQWEQLNAQYIVRHDDKWEWNLRRLFADALAGKDYMPYATLMGIVLGLSHIADKNQYYAVYRQALEQGVISEERHPSTGQQLVRLVQEADLPF